MYISTAIFDEFRDLSEGAGYGCQIMINDALKLSLGSASNPVDETVVR